MPAAPTTATFVVVWTHEKLGADDHVDMLGIAPEPGRAPTTFASWWNGVNDYIGKCRPKVCGGDLRRDDHRADRTTVVAGAASVPRTGIDSMQWLRSW